MHFAVFGVVFCLDILGLSLFFSCSLAACLSVIYVFFRPSMTLGKLAEKQELQQQLNSLPADKLVSLS